MSKTKVSRAPLASSLMPPDIVRFCPETPETVVQDRREIGTIYALAPPGFTKIF
jgi:hypothetical protein